MNKLQKFLKRKDTRKVAQEIYLYHSEHGINDDALRNWSWACDFYNSWWDSYTERKVWEGTLSRLYPKNIMTLRELLRVWLDTSKYGYIPKKDEHTTKPWWRIF